MPKDRGAEQGDVDGPLECSIALGTVDAETCGRVAAKQASGSFPWIGVDDPSQTQRPHAEYAHPGCTTSPIFISMDLKTSPELTIHVMLYKRTEAMATNGDMLMSPGLGSVLLVTSSMTPMPNLVRNVTRSKRKSIAT